MPDEIMAKVINVYWHRKLRLGQQPRYDED